MEYNKMTLNALRELCKKQCIKGFSTKSKAVLIELLKSKNPISSPATNEVVESSSTTADSAPTNPKKSQVDVSDISTFFSTSTRNKNDATNKIREDILDLVCNEPDKYISNVEHGNKWRIVYEELNNVLKELAERTGISGYTSIKYNKKGGRNSNYDAEIMYYNGTTLLETKKIEFKYGAKSIYNLPQFLSLQTKAGLFTVTYDTFWYKNYLDKYIECDPEITQAKPTLEDYLKHVAKTTYTTHPFIQQLKERELMFKKEKDDVVKRSITDYLTQYGHTIDISGFSERVKSTQKDKYYLMFYKGKFYMDNIPDKDMTEMSYHSIVKGNTLWLKTGNTVYKLLLRWRNHKGILNPAWQISLKRLA